MDNLQTQLLNHLKQYCQGKARARTVRDLAIHFRVTDREIRAMLLGLNLAGYPVATSCHPPMGVYWATEQANLDEYWMNLNSRVLKLLARMRAVNKIKTKEFVQRQLELF